MADSVQDKQAKGKSEAIDEVIEDNFEKITSEIENQDDVDSLDMRPEKLLFTQANKSLEDLLEFDAQVLASSSVAGVDIESDEFSQSIENQYPEDPSFNIIDEPEEARQSAKEIEQVQNELVDENLGFEYEQQGSNPNSALINAQNEKIFQLESELSVLKKMLAVQLDVDKRLEKSNTKFKIISVFALIIASLALLLNFWEGALDANIKVVSGEPQKWVIDVKQDSVVPVNSQINDVQPQPLALVTENNKPEKILVEPEDDISYISTADNAVKGAGVDNAQIKGWVVNLNSYEQLWEADKKIEELKEKGISTDMIIVSVKGVRWYRIRITGFKTKAEASSYAATIKEILKVSHAWVSKL